MKPTTLAFLLILTAACASKSFQPVVQDRTSVAVDASAQSVASAFYTEVRRERIEGLPTAAQLKRLTPYLTPEIVAGFQRAGVEQREFMKAHPDDKPPFIEGDLFSSLFEGVSTWKVGAAAVTGAKAEVPLQLTFSSDGQTSRWSDTLLLKKTPDGWLVADIRMGGEWAFKPGSNTLSATLSAKP